MAAMSLRLTAIALPPDASRPGLVEAEAASFQQHVGGDQAVGAGPAEFRGVIAGADPDARGRRSPAPQPVDEREFT